MKEFIFLLIFLGASVYSHKQMQETILDENNNIKIVDTSYHVSESGKDFIKEMENCSLISYKDGKYYSIGYGHNSRKVKENMIITEEEANKLFDNDIKKVDESLNFLLKDINYHFPQNFIDGMGSLIYNCGERGVRRSQFYKKLRKCRIKHTTINEEDIIWTISFVLKKDSATHISRRKKEYDLMIQDFKRN